MSKCPYCQKEIQPNQIIAERFEPHGFNNEYVTLECPQCRTILSIRNIG